MKLIKIFIITLSIVTMLSTNVFALGEIFERGESWETTGDANKDTTMSTVRLRQASNALYNLLLAGATVVAVIVGAMLGVKYMSAGISEKVDVKQSLYPYIISCIVVFGSLGIWKLVVTVMSKI